MSRAESREYSHSVKEKFTNVVKLIIFESENMTLFVFTFLFIFHFHVMSRLAGLGANSKLSESLFLLSFL